MALLSQTNQDKYLKALGFKSVLAFQKDAFTSKKQQDGIYGINTDNALRTYYNVYKYTKNFKPSEFKCECGGKYCAGYPTYMKPSILKNIQDIRSHWGVPITITCGMRCSGYNKALNGSISNSKHLQGLAVDFYGKGVTDTLANRKTAIKWIKKLPNHTYSYGNGINSDGKSLSAPYMGNALHTDCKNGTVEEPKVEADFVKNVKAFAKKYADDNSYKYRKWSESNKYTHQCPLCHPESNKHATKGWNCRGFVSACMYHGGGLKNVECSCKGLGLLGKKIGDYTLANFEKYNGKGWKRIYNSGNNLKASQLKDGDIIFYFNTDKTMKHVALVYDIKNGKIADATSSNGITIRKPSTYGKVAFRWIG